MLDRVWTLQKPNGGFEWLKCGWPPLEYDDYYGALVAALGAGRAPDDYARSEPARSGLERLRDYFRNTPPPDLHHQTMLLWAATRLDGLMKPEQKTATVHCCARFSMPTAAGASPRWASGNGATAHPTIPPHPATATPRD